jgi:tRNA threonylcarbamoyladenosine biosynthesis protein TsaE
MTHVTILASPSRVDTVHARIVWRDEADCARTAVALADSLRPILLASGTAIIELNGTLGAGKTTLTRHLLRALGVQGRVKSPSYAVVEPYELPGHTVQHFDFYRFNDPQEWEDAGFRDLFAAPGLKIVEWPDKAAGLLPEPDLRVHIEIVADEVTDKEGEGRRQVDFEAHSAIGRAAVTGLDQISAHPDTGAFSHE